jgi:hypothetical protein
MAGREKLNIVLLCQSLATGGLEQMVVNLAAGLDRERYHRTIGCIERREDLVEQAQSQGIEVFFLDKGPGVKLGAVWKLSQILRNRKTDILHTHNAGSLLYGVPAGKLAGVPSIVHTEHGRLIGETERVAPIEESGGCLAGPMRWRRFRNPLAKSIAGSRVFRWNESRSLAMASISSVTRNPRTPG